MRARDSVSDNGDELGELQGALPELRCFASLGLQRVCGLVSAVVPCNQLELEFRRLLLFVAECGQAFVRLCRVDILRDGARVVPRLEPW